MVSGKVPVENIFTLASSLLLSSLFDSVILQGIALPLLSHYYWRVTSVCTDTISLITRFGRTIFVKGQCISCFVDDRIWGPSVSHSMMQQILSYSYLVFTWSCWERQCQGWFLFWKSEETIKLKRKENLLLIFVTAGSINTLRVEREQRLIKRKKDQKITFRRKNEKSIWESEIFIHASESSFFLAMGHVDICYQGQVISYGSTWPSLRALVWDDWRRCF